MEIIAPVTHDLGAFKVRRALPAKARTMVGPFVFVDQFGPARLEVGEGMDVRPHPHIGLSTLTYLFDGRIRHRDSLGSDLVIEPGAVNLMTAGAGIVHSERSPDAARAEGPTFYGMQTWLALPDGQEEAAPAFEHVAAERLPVVRDGGLAARVLLGTLWGATAPTRADAPAVFADLRLAAGTSAPIDAGTEERAVMLTEGQATLDGLTLEPFALHVLAPGQAMTLAAVTPTRAVLLGGAAFATPRHVWWNFVSSSRDRIAQARDDWRAGRFASVAGDPEFIPVPDRPNTVSYP